MDSTKTPPGIWVLGRYVKSIDDVVPQREPDPREKIISDSVEGARVMGLLREAARREFDVAVAQAWATHEAAMKAALDQASYKAALDWAEQNLAAEAFKNAKSQAAATFAADRQNPSLSYTDVYNAYRSAVEWAEDNLAGAPFWNARSEAKALLDSALAAIATEHDAAVQALRDVNAEARSTAYTSFKTAVASAASELEPFVLDADAAKEAAFQAASAQYIATVGSARASADAVREPARAQAYSTYRDTLDAAKPPIDAAFDAAVVVATVIYNAAIDQAVIEGIAAAELEKRRQERELAAAKRITPRVFPQW